MSNSYNNGGFGLKVRCDYHQDLVDSDRVSEYKGRTICDECADKELHPERHNATLFEIIAEAEKMWLAKTASTIATCGVAVIEDEEGDIVFFNEGCAELFIAPAVTGQTATDYLPQEARLTHRRAHRQAISQSIPKEYWFAAGDERWTAELHPFTALNETFTLSLFSKAA
jgi:PAS domain-containing protein